MPVNKEGVSSCSDREYGSTDLERFLLIRSKESNDSIAEFDERIQLAGYRIGRQGEDSRG